MRILFSIHFGDSVAHVLRTRGLAKRLSEEGHEIRYSVSRRAFPYLDGYVDGDDRLDNNQNYGFSRFESMSVLCKRFCECAVIESDFYMKFKPNLVIGDMGLLASVYCIDTPFIKILNRFFLEIYGKEQHSILTSYQKEMVTRQVELMINSARKKIRIKEQFNYSDFLNGPIIINGVKEFVNTNMPTGIYSGIRLGLSLPDNFEPDESVAFVALGTGIAPTKMNNTEKVLCKIAPIFRKIYVSTGTGIDNSYVKTFRNCVVKTTFDRLPKDIGCIICHGGYGAVHTGLLLNIPTYVIPYHIEHFCNGSRLEQMNGGRCFGNLHNAKFNGIQSLINIKWDNFSKAFNNYPEQRVQQTRVKDISDDNSLHGIIKNLIASQLP